MTIEKQKKMIKRLFSSLNSHRNKSTTWIDPRPKHYAAFQTFCSTLPLPDGLEQIYDVQGNSYFIDHKTKQTHWDDPRPSKDLFSFLIVLIHELLFSNRFLSFIDDKETRYTLSII